MNKARHLAALRDIAVRTGGITEFVPLPFVHMEAPVYGQVRRTACTSSRLEGQDVLQFCGARLAVRAQVSSVAVLYHQC